METPDHISALRLVGGNVALDFANTAEGAPGEKIEPEHLLGYEDLVYWGHHAGLLSDEVGERLLREERKRPSEANAVLSRALEFRDHVYEIFRAIAEGDEPPAEDLGTLRLAECEALSHARLVPGDGGYVWKWEDDGDLARVLWPVAHATTELLTGGSLERVKACAGCRWLFVDESKNGSRRWCSMEDCGTREKVRRYVERRAGRRGQAGQR